MSIKTGYWVDYSQPPGLRGTLTYSSNAGNQLISAASIVVQFAGGALWIILSQYIHHWLSKPDTHDELDAQRRAVLRNQGSLDAAVKLVQMGFAWRGGHASRSWMRTVTLSLLPTVIFIGFLVAGIFVGQIAYSPGSSYALLKSSNCGLVAAHTANQILSNITEISTTYANDCYSQDQSNAVACTKFVKPRLAYTFESNASCPIGDGNCALGDNNAVQLSVLANSHYDLGINAPSGDRILAGYQLTCAPVRHHLFTRFVHASNEYDIRTVNGSYDLLNVNVGDYQGKNSSMLIFSEVATMYSDNALNYIARAWRSWYPFDGTFDNLTVFPPFNNANGDVTVMTISANGIRYQNQSSDPIFGTNDTIGPLGYYHALHPINALVCNERYRICKTSKLCSDWFTVANVSTYDGIDSISTSLGLNAAQNATYNRVAATIILDNFQLLVSLPNALKATSLLVFNQGISSAVPNNQWQAEVEYFFQSSLAKLQYTTQLYSDTPESFIDAPGSEFFRPKDDTPHLQAQCHTQRVQTPSGYTSYNVFALVFIFCVAVFFILIAVLQKMYYLRAPTSLKGFRKKEEGQEEFTTYQADSLLHLQRAALEAKAGIGPWKLRKAGSEIPYIEKAQKRVDKRALTFKSDFENKGFQTDELIR